MQSRRRRAPAPLRIRLSRRRSPALRAEDARQRLRAGVPGAADRLRMSVLTTLLFYWGILPPVVRGFSFVLNRTMGVGGAVGLATAANIFVGHVEAPLFIRPYLTQLSRSELFVVMTGGMAGIAGTV